MSTPTIQSLEAIPVIVPMSVPHKTASATITESPLVLINLRLDDGCVGHAMLFTYTPAALSSVTELVRNLEAMVAGQLLAPKIRTETLHDRFKLLGTQGIVGMALAGLDMAMWDAHCRSSQQSLVSALGGVVQPVKAYGSIGFDGVEGSRDAASELIEAGFTAFKAKIGYDSVVDDLAVVEAMREVAGESVDIMVDYNQSLTPTEAIERVRVLDSMGLVWVEEPTLAHDYEGHARISASVETPIQCGENWWGPLDFQHAVSASASDYVMPDVMKIGGITGWTKAAAIAETANLPVSSHLWPEVSARLLCCTRTAHYLEYADWWNPVLQRPIQIENGCAVVDDSPGSGILWDDDAVTHFRVDT